MFAHRRPRHSLLAAAVAACALVGLVSASNAGASHFRYGNLSWDETSSHQSAFTYVAAFRRDSYPGSASDGRAAPGDIIDEFIGATDLAFGDGGNTGQLRFLVTSINPSENWLQGIALQPGSNTDTLIDHDYSGFTGADKDNFTAISASCCTIASLFNNADNNYGLQNQLHFQRDDQSPVSGLPTIVGVGNSGVQTFNVPASDPDVPGTNHFLFRIPAAGSAECGGCASSAPTGLSINPATGQVSWDTTGMPDGLYYHSYVIEERDPSNVVESTTMVAGLIRVSSTAVNQAPAWNTPPTPNDGHEFNVAPGGNVSFNLSATDPDSADTVTISGSGIPAGATFTPTNGNPATASFSWTPGAGDEGDYVLNFTPTDDHSLSGPFRTFTIHVRSTEGPFGDPSCSDGLDNDGDGQTDSADSDCDAPATEGPAGDPTCSDGVDNDGDGQTDAADSDCVAAPPSSNGKCFGQRATVSGNTGTAGDDVIIGTPGPDRIFGQGGNDTICSRAGDDVVSAGNGNDKVDASLGNDQVFGGGGNDRLLGVSGSDRLTGDAGDDELFGVDGDDSLTGGTGMDLIVGGIGDDTAFGGDDADDIRGQDNDDRLFGGAADDQLRGGNNSDQLHGGADTDVCDGGPDGDTSTADCESSPNVP